MKLKLKTLSNVIIAMLLLVLGGVVGYRYAIYGRIFNSISLPFLPKNTSFQVSHDSKKPSKYNSLDFKVFWEVWDALEKNYLYTQELDHDQMLEGAVGGIATALEDPYTVFLPKEANERNGEDLSGAFYGVGIELGYIDQTLAVVAPLKGTPAEAAGIQAGDLIIHVKDTAKGLDEDTSGWSLTEAVEKIRGKKDTEVILTLYREPDDGSVKAPFDVSVKRGEIVVKSVEMEEKEINGKKIAHISLSRFGERTKDEWDEVVKQILEKKDQYNGIILDMRNNPGGYLETSIDIASDFVKKGIVVSQKGKYETIDYKTTGTARLADLPVIVLVNQGSASASEIVAGALKYDNNNKLVGEQTFGKGTVQERVELSDGAGLHVTIAEWIMPNGESINKKGIPVDVEIKQDYTTEEDEVLNKAVELF